MGRRTGVLALVGWMAAAACSPPAPPEGAVALVNVRLVPTSGDGPAEAASLLIRDGLIERVLRGDPAAFAPGPDVIDGGGGYLLPGLVDPHVHVREPAELALLLSSGVTSVRNMNGNFGEPLVWRAAIEAGELAGPRFVTSSPTLFDESESYRWHVAGPDEARRMAREFASEGYDLIKVYHLAEPTFLALADEARSVGIPVAGHYPAPGSDLATILSSGMRSVEHLDELVVPAFDGVPDYDAIPVVVEQIRRSGTAVGTILSQWEMVNRGLAEPDALLTDSLRTVARTYYGAEGAERLEEMARGMRERDEASRARDRSDFPFLYALLKALVRAGVPVIPSTDAHQVLAPAGEGLVNELEVWVRAGLTPRDALRAATIDAAEAIGLGGQVGRIQEGMGADLLLVADNPLDDLDALRRPVGVMVRGEWLDASRLESMRAEALPRP